MPSRACIASYFCKFGYNCNTVSMPSRACIASRLIFQMSSDSYVSMPSRACIASSTAGAVCCKSDCFNALPGMYCFLTHRKICNCSIVSMPSRACIASAKTSNLSLLYLHVFAFLYNFFLPTRLILSQSQFFYKYISSFFGANLPLLFPSLPIRTDGV